MQLHFIVHEQEKLNDFDEKGLSILASCLEQMEGGTNVGALKEGMRSGIIQRSKNTTFQPRRHPCIMRSLFFFLLYDCLEFYHLFF